MYLVLAPSCSYRQSTWLITRCRSRRRGTCQSAEAVFAAAPAPALAAEGCRLFSPSASAPAPAAASAHLLPLPLPARGPCQPFARSFQFAIAWARSTTARACDELLVGAAWLVPPAAGTCCCVPILTAAALPPCTEGDPSAGASGAPESRD